MWTRLAIKNYAKGFLRKHYWKAFAVCLIATLLTGGINSGNNNNQNETYYIDNIPIVEEFEPSNSILNYSNNYFRSPLLNLVQGASLIIAIVFTVLIIVVGYLIEVGQSRFFLRGFKGDVKISTVFSTFNSDELLPIVKTSFLRSIYNFLWFLLLFIPGIIKYYEYKFVPYILAEQPQLTSNEIISKSREITYGHKIDMFVLDLSFLGWYFLGALLCGIGVIFVNPYINATYARLYNVLAGNDAINHEGEAIDAH